MSHPHPPSEDLNVHIDLDQPPTEGGDGERRLNTRITGLLIVSVVLAIGLVASTVLYSRQIDQTDELRQQLAEAEAKIDALSATSTTPVDVGNPPVIVPLDDDQLELIPLMFDCEKSGWYPLDDPSRIDEAVAIDLGDTVVYCLEQP